MSNSVTDPKRISPQQSLRNAAVAYFSMEIGLEGAMPTYSGGLGVLAGDTLRSAADLKIPMVGVTLLSRKGYFSQKIDSSGRQAELPDHWIVEHHLRALDGRVEVEIEGRNVVIGAWEYVIKGITGFEVRVYLLDSDLEENSAYDRGLTDCLYGGDARYRLAQEIILGIGGLRMLRALGYCEIERFHMNEGHASLLTLELLEEQIAADPGRKLDQEDMERVRRRCVFTTHTPTAAGHDRFPLATAMEILGATGMSKTADFFCFNGTLDMTFLALHFSRFVNGVGKKHRDVSRRMFARPDIDGITNGIHAGTWAAPSFQRLFDIHIPDWRQDNAALRHALRITNEEIWQAHVRAKRDLLAKIREKCDAAMDENTFTIGFARRVTGYKRNDLLFTNIKKLRAISAASGPFQIIYAGKAHPKDDGGKEMIRSIFRAIEALKGEIKIVYVPGYDMDFAKVLVAGCDLWLNNPSPPMEASGTSGMKAAVNGVPSLSSLDGWWLEGCIEGVTGWSIGSPPLLGAGDQGERDADSIYQKLEEIILPMFYRQPSSYRDILRHTIAINGSFFNTHRMLQEYVVNAYFRKIK